MNIDPLDACTGQHPGCGWAHPAEDWRIRRYPNDHALYIDQRWTGLDPENEWRQLRIVFTMAEALEWLSEHAHDEIDRDRAWHEGNRAACH